ncbi:hypothetical protein AB0O47_32805 [Streptomyces noursei]|uniref:hypothetical protein n=1 Tax=Streptomyces noursei TaxID=1971 RepID=UPI003450BF11
MSALRLDNLLPKARAWSLALTSPSWWALPPIDRTSYRLGYESAFWMRRQVRRSGLCSSCWMRESAPDPQVCEGGQCRNNPARRPARAHC